MKISIRDDDLCYFSDYRLFKEVYDALDVPVSISLVPYGVSYHEDKHPYGDIDDLNKRDVADNTDLINYLKGEIRNNKAEILLHGYSHEYKLINNKWVPEMLWKSYDQLRNEIKLGKEHLEDIFHKKISVFVAPSQAISKKGIKVLEENNLNFSGMAARIGDRKLSFRFIKILLKRFYNRIKYGIAIQGLMDYKKHKELGVIPPLDFECFKKIYNIFKKHNWNMTIVVHYWDLYNDKDKLENLKNILFFLKSENNDFCFLSELFN